MKKVDQDNLLVYWESFSVINVKTASKTSISEALEHIRYKAIVTEKFVDYLSYVLEEYYSTFSDLEKFQILSRCEK